MRKESDRFWLRYDKVQQAEPTETITNQNGLLYAILFNAEGSGNNECFSEDLNFVHQSLTQSGVAHSRISALEGNGKTKNWFITGPATTTSLEKAVNSVRQQATSRDRLVVVVTNHGNLINNKSTVRTYDGRMNEVDFEQIMHNLPVNFALFYFAQCYSGGFAERIGYGRNIAVSSASRTGWSNGHKGISMLGTTLLAPVGNHFTHYLFKDVLKYGNTIESAFDTAVNTDTSLLRFVTVLNPNTGFETPQLRWQNADPAKLYLN